MPYFPVDDDFSDHPKAIAAGNAAIGLWTRAGSWSKKHAQGGFVPDEKVRALGTRAQADRLVQVGLWDRVPGGYRFHDWEHVGDNADAPTEQQRADRKREQARDRMRRMRELRAAEAAARDAVTPPVTLYPYPYPYPQNNYLGQIQSGSDAAGVTDDAHTVSEPVDNLRVAVVLAQETGRDATPQQAHLVALTIMGRRGTPPAKPTAYVVGAIRRDPFPWQQYLDTGRLPS